MKNNILLLYKKLGETPLDTITRYKQEVSPLSKDKLSFAGRLDPMAEGLLLVLRGEENKKRHEYESLSKTYECSFFCGVATDTYDLLGKVISIQNHSYSHIDVETQLTTIIASLLGKKAQTYPPFSSYHIKGKPLYYWTRENKLDTITLPTKEITIYTADVIKFEVIPRKILEEDILKRLSLISGNFRQEDIKKIWQKTFPRLEQKEFLVTHLTITCSSGTYIRGLVQTIGETLGIPCVTISILRTAIGSFTLSDLSWYS
ncbi:hypothetical protein BH11PAT1_BH11PAT1_0660 [soil metagenome]